MIDMPSDRCHPNLSRGYAYVEYETSEDAQKALKHMDGGTFFQFRSFPGGLFACALCFNLINVGGQGVIKFKSEILLS